MPRFGATTAERFNGEALYYVRHGGAGHSRPSSAIYIINRPVVAGLKYTATAWIRCRDMRELSSQMWRCPGQRFTIQSDVNLVANRVECSGECWCSRIA